MNKAIDEVIQCIKEDENYINYLTIRERMSNNKDLMKLINEVKSLQKKYVRSNSDEDLNNLNNCKRKLEDIPLYVEYMKNLNNINEKIEYVKDELNDYFYKVLNS